MAKRERIFVDDAANFNSSANATTNASANATTAATTAAAAKDESMTIVSYNVLADCHVDHDMDMLYTKCERGDLYISGRFEAIAAEVAAYQPDIVCFQEVPPEYYHRDFKPRFEKLGFDGVYMKRVADTHHEGEATFFKSSKLELVRSVSKSLRELLKERLPSDEALTPSAWDYVTRPDVTIVCRFRSRDSGREFVVANAHISFVGYKLRDLQALQTTTVLKSLTDLARVDDNGDSYLPHLVVGDFNQQPESPGYRILQEGILPEDAQKELLRHRHFDAIDVQSEEATAKEAEANDVQSEEAPMQNGVVDQSEEATAKEGEANDVQSEEAPMQNGVDDQSEAAKIGGGGELNPANKTGLFHLLGPEYFGHSSPGLKSAYFEALKGWEPRVTCIDLEQEEQKQTLDYIWFSHHSLRLESVVDVPSEAQIDAQVAFPSQIFPSDHLSLCATFRFVGDR